MKSDTTSPFHWLGLEARVAKTTKLIEPGAPIVKGDHLVGELDADMQRLFTVMSEMNADLEVKKTRIEKLLDAMQQPQDDGVLAVLRSISSGETPERKEQAQEVERLAREIYLGESEWTAVKSLFYHELRIRYPEIVDRHHIGVREGWKVCWSDCSSSAEILEEMLLATFGPARPSSNRTDDRD